MASHGSLHIYGLHAGTPDDSGIALQVVAELGPELPVFGVCMGHQCIGQARTEVHRCQPVV